MKIVEIISDLGVTGGGQTLTIELANSFANKGIDILVVSLYNSSNSYYVRYLQSKNIKVICLNKKRGIDIKCSQELKRIVYSFNPDAVHAHLNTYLTIYLSKIFKSYKVFYTFHSIINRDNSGSRTRLDNLLIRRMITKKQIIPIGISELVSNSIANFYKIDKPVVIMNGVDTKRFIFKDTNKNIDFIVIGSFTDIKNQILILKSFEILKRKRETNIVFAGDGPLLENCIAYANSNGISNASFLGNIHNVEKFLEKSKFLVMASSFEGNPMVINEAISCGTFVISNDVGGIPDLIKNETVGFLFSHSQNNPEYISNIMDKCLDDYSFIIDRIRTNIDKNRDMVSIENTCLSYLNLFNDCRIK